MGSGVGGASYNSDGDPNVLGANRNDDGQWLNANFDHPDNRWNDHGAFAFVVLATHSHFSFACAREFCFSTCPIQPPSIRPISSNLVEIIMYFLVSIDFVSHKINKSSLSASSFRIARRR